MKSLIITLATICLTGCVEQQYHTANNTKTDHIQQNEQDNNNYTAQTISDLWNEDVINQLTTQHIDEQEKAYHAALEKYPSNKPYEWSNNNQNTQPSDNLDETQANDNIISPNNNELPDDEVHGSITPLQTYQTNGKYCRTFIAKININSKSHSKKSSACRNNNLGTWELQQQTT